MSGPGVSKRHVLVEEGRRLLRDARLACTPRAQARLATRIDAWSARARAEMGMAYDGHGAIGLEEMLSMLESQSVEARSAALADDCVFVVHGRDDGRREAVARLVETLGLRAVVLDERPMRGRALLEKFEQEARAAGYAIVIAVPEDRAAGPGEPIPDEPNRARQNVILEVGYFMGVLGRDRVSVLFRAPLELPSDLSGLGYIEMDGDWRYRLAHELASAGMRVDLSRLLGP